jgi:hypothetical protein
MLTNLRVALKQFEKEHQPKKSKPNIVKVISETPESERQDIEELEGMVHQTGPSVLASWSLNVWCDLISHDSQSGCVLLVHNVDNRSYYPERHTLSVGQ